ncbi:DMT family transporter [Dechloromonas denitrificans]|uniref:DMT family transporter n=1 Tax=Dechloromonas denitrificans TaxID=281362 RepID=UPI001CF80189|nr:DMT family transporter [Dechloromonas denitrificans]UCV12654.1 DMT family transporter [Dechloromonas denitrificans]
MPHHRRLIFLVALAMTAFAANSLLCRLALKTSGIDAGSFTGLRLASGALVLWLIVRWRGPAGPAGGSWAAATALFIYAAGFSYAYIQLPTATGALLLFGAVQVTMIGVGLWRGERLQGWQMAGLGLAVSGLLALLTPGLSAPPPDSAALMLSAGVAWGIYSLLGKRLGNPTLATAGNFLRTLPFAALLSLATLPLARLDSAGVIYALASGGLASGLGYALWYAVLPSLAATHAATVQLSVPVLAALGGILFLGETVSWSLALSSAAILGGIALVIGGKERPR